MLWEPTTINCGGQILDLEHPIVMGILNMTPDSFYAGSRFAEQTAVEQAAKMIGEGASILDVGGMSSRPGASKVSIDEELARVVPAIRRIHEVHPNTPISIDTVHAKVAEAALNAGATMVNDISACQFDPALLDLVVERNVPYVLMHMLGTPQTMQDEPTYQHVVIEILDFLIQKLAVLSDRGLHDVIVDPGIGFGKSVADNFILLQNLHTFKILDKHLMVGLSRKSFIQKTLGISAAQSLPGTTALHMVALEQGAKILRVHDVAEAMQCIKLHRALQENSTK